MDEGSSALPFPPLQVLASSHVSLRNSFIVPLAVFDGALRWILLPFLMVIGFARYLALVTSRRPVWPKSVDVACEKITSAEVFREPTVYGDIPGGKQEEVAFLDYWNAAEKKARSQDEKLSKLFT
jgi:hypothetical protein